MDKQELINIAFKLPKTREHNPQCITGEVACALVTKKGNVYSGISISCACGIGFCAEYSAISSMVTNGESEIEMIVAIDNKSNIYPPCGRCRELMLQINLENVKTKVILDKKIIKLEKLMPYKWQDCK